MKTTTRMGVNGGGVDTCSTMNRRKSMSALNGAPLADFPAAKGIFRLNAA